MAEDLFFNKVSIIGVGLIGASFALALRKKGLCKTIYGYGRKEENLKRAKDKGIIDDYSLDVREACGGSDLILLSTPVGTFRDIIAEISDSIKKGAVVTDVGSVKGRLVLELESLMPEGVSYIGSHPIAGSDRSGIDDARADLFNNARCIITPTKDSDNDALRKVSSVWETIGGRVEQMDPFKHDEIYAALSHLPHIIAYALVNIANDIDPDNIGYAGRGFKDTTRIAMSSPEIWRDISLSNKENLIRMIDSFKGNLDRIKKHLEEGDASGIEKEFLRAQILRKKLDS